MFQWTQDGILEILVRNQEKSFTMKVIKHRSKLLRTAVGFPSLELLRTQLDHALSKLILMDLVGWEVGPENSRGPFQPNYSKIFFSLNRTAKNIAVVGSWIGNTRNWKYSFVKIFLS